MRQLVLSFSIVTFVGEKQFSYKLKPDGALWSTEYVDRAYDDYWVKVSDSME